MLYLCSDVALPVLSIVRGSLTFRTESDLAFGVVLWGVTHAALYLETVSLRDS